MANGKRKKFTLSQKLIYHSDRFQNPEKYGLSYNSLKYVYSKGYIYGKERIHSYSKSYAEKDHGKRGAYIFKIGFRNGFRDR